MDQMDGLIERLYAYIHVAGVPTGPASECTKRGLDRLTQRVILYAVGRIGMGIAYGYATQEPTGWRIGRWPSTGPQEMPAP